MSVLSYLHNKHLEYINLNNPYSVFYIDETTYYIVSNKLSSSCLPFKYRAEDKELKSKIIDIKDFIFQEEYKNGYIYVKTNTLPELNITFDASNISKVYDSFNNNFYDSSWIDLIENKITDPHLLSRYHITAKTNLDASSYHYISSSEPMITYEFSHGIYQVNQQIWLSPNTTIIGANIPNKEFGTFTEKAGVPGLSGDSLKMHTIFSTLSGDGNPLQQGFNPEYCNNLTQKGIDRENKWTKGDPKIDKFAKLGFLLNTNTHLSNFLFQGFMSPLPGPFPQGGPCGRTPKYRITDYYNSSAKVGGGLAGGGVFELPGCIGQRYSSSNKEGLKGCYFEMWSTDDGVDNATTIGWSTAAYNGEHGKAVNNVSISNVRVNSLNENSILESTSKNTKLSNVLFWSPTNVDASSGNRHSNIKLNNIVSLQTMADGINVQGTVSGFDATNIAVLNAGDDTFAVWGGTLYSDTPKDPSNHSIDFVYKTLINRLCPYNKYYGPKNIKFTNILGHQFKSSAVSAACKKASDKGVDCGVDPTRPYGGCVGVFGFEDNIDICGIACYPDLQSQGTSDPSPSKKGGLYHLDATFCGDYSGVFTINKGITENGYDTSFTKQCYTGTNSPGCTPDGSAQICHKYSDKNGGYTRMVEHSTYSFIAAKCCPNAPSDLTYKDIIETCTDNPEPQNAPIGARINYTCDGQKINCSSSAPAPTPVSSKYKCLGDREGGMCVEDSWGDYLNLEDCSANCGSEKLYKCKDNTCIESSEGVSLAKCQENCVQQKLYKCKDNKCIESSGGSSLSDCNLMCEPS